MTSIILTPADKISLRASIISVYILIPVRFCNNTLPCILIPDKADAKATIVVVLGATPIVI